jgi:hypothetical protein
LLLLIEKNFLYLSCTCAGSGWVVFGSGHHQVLPLPPLICLPWTTTLNSLVGLLCGCSLASGAGACSWSKRASLKLPCFYGSIWMKMRTPTRTIVRMEGARKRSGSIRLQVERLIDS